MPRTIVLSTVLAVSTILAGGSAHAADPTNADCLAASDASLKAGNEHKLRAERGQLLICAAASCPVDIRKECNRRIDELSAEIPTIVFEVKDADGHDLSAVRIKMENEILTEHLEGTALSIDPGEHNFTFESPGQPTLTRMFLIRQAQKDRREVVILGEGTGTKAGSRTAMPMAGTTAPSSGSSADSSGGLGTQKILALTAGGVGVAGLVLSGVFYGMELSTKGAAQTECPTSTCTTADGVNKWNAVGTDSHVALAGFIVGLVGVGGAAALWFTAPSSNGTAQVGFGPGMVQFKEVF